MTDLTEKWKNKELKWHKSYYCKNKKGEIVIATLMGDDVLYSAELGGTLNFSYWEVLAECNYEELQRLESDSLAKNEEIDSSLWGSYQNTLIEINELKKKIHILTESQMKLENTIGELGTENARLKELLKECQKFFEEENQHSFTSCFEMKYELLTKIEEALK